MKVLLLQTRKRQDVSDHEFEHFVRFTGIPEQSMHRWNFIERAPDPSDIKNYDAVLLGGSGSFLVSAGDLTKNIQNLKPVLDTAREQGKPTLGICFGAQIMSKLYAGDDYLDEDKKENGTYEIKTTPEAREDELLKDYPETFQATLGHKDHIIKPPSATHLASSDLSDVQAWRFPGEPTYAFTFHPELDQQAMIDRFNYYATEYSLTPEIIKQKTEAMQPTPHAHAILKGFFDRYVKNCH